MKQDSGWRVANHSRWMWALIEVGLAICIINIIAWQLTVYYYDYYTNQWSTVACLLGTNDQGDNLCQYGYAIASVSLGATCLLMFTQCMGCRCFPFADLWIEILLTLFGVVWWLVASILMVEWNNGDNRQTSDGQKYVNAIIGLSWTSFAIFIFDFLGAVFMLMFVAFGKFGGDAAHAKIQAENQRVNEINQQYVATMGPAAAAYGAAAYGTPIPAHMGGSPAYAGTPPGYGAAPGYGAPPPGYGAPPPGYGAPPQQAYGAPAGYATGGAPAGYPTAAPAGAPPPPTGIVMAPDIDLGAYKPHK